MKKMNKIIAICCIVSLCHFPVAEPRKRSGGRDKLPIKDEAEAAPRQVDSEDKRKKASGKNYLQSIVHYLHIFNCEDQHQKRAQHRI